MVSSSHWSPPLVRVTQTVVSGVTVLVWFSVIAVWWMLATRWMRASVSGGQPEQPRVTSATTLALPEAHWFHCAPGPSFGVRVDEQGLCQGVGEPFAGAHVSVCGATVRCRVPGERHGKCLASDVFSPPPYPDPR